MSTVQIIVASTRPGRIGPTVADWVQARAVAHGGFDAVELIDLAEVDLPFMNEPNHPRLRRYVHQHTRDWSARIDAGDAFIFVMPEYNHGFNAELKNALDYLSQEWQYKPVGLVSYGGGVGGSRAAQMIKQVLVALRMTPVTDSVAIAGVHRLCDNGQLTPGDIAEASAKSMFDELTRMTELLRPLRGGAGS